MFGSVTVQEGAPARGAERQRRLLLGRALLLHQRDQLAGDEGKGDEHRREHDAGHGEDDLDAVRPSARRRTGPARRRAARRQAGDHRRDREGQVDQGDQQALAAEVELGDRPGRGDAEDQVERHGDGGDEQRQPDRRDARPGPSKAARYGASALRAALRTKTASSGSSRNSARKADRDARSRRSARGSSARRRRVTEVRASAHGRTSVRLQAWRG